MVITHHDRLEELKRAVRSALDQGELVAEVIVVDDASKGVDEAAIVAALPDDARLRVLRMAKNVGAQRARNAGIERSRAPYIALLDSDDEWKPGKLAEQLAFLHREDLDICACGIEKSHDGEVEKVRMPAYRGDATRYLLVEGGHLQTSTLLGRTECFQAVGFDVDVRKFQDWDFVIRAETEGYRIGFLPKVLVVYHFGATGQMTGTPRPELAEQFIDRHRAILGEEVWNLAKIRIVARMCAETGQYQGCLRQLMRSQKALGRPDVVGVTKALYKLARHQVRGA